MIDVGEQQSCILLFNQYMEAVKAQAKLSSLSLLLYPLVLLKLLPLFIFF